MTLEPAQIADQGKQAFESKNFIEAAELFRQAAEEFTAGNSALMAADQIFAEAKDIKRQGMAVGNQAAALEGLNRYDEAIAAFERSAELFAQAGEGDLRSMVMKSAAAIKLKTGKITDSAFKMMGSLDVKENPSFFERILKFFLRFIK